MNLNPYQTPETEEPQPPVATGTRYIGPLEYFFIAVFAIAAGAALAHRWGDPAAYRHSPLIAVELIGVLLLVLLVLAFLFQTVLLLALGKLRRAAVSAIFGVLSFFAAIVPLWIDAPLMYIT